MSYILFRLNLPLVSQAHTSDNNHSAHETFWKKLNVWICVVQHAHLFHIHAAAEQ